jgi:hypothetical protein
MAARATPQSQKTQYKLLPLLERVELDDQQSQQLRQHLQRRTRERAKEQMMGCPTT